MNELTVTQLFDLQFTEARSLLERASYPWECLPYLKDFIPVFGAGLSEADYDHPAESLWIHKTAKVAPTAYLGQRVIIGAGAQVRHGAYIRGDAFIGKEAVVGNSTELKNALLFDKVQVPHYNYVGDSVLGYCAHLGAGVVLSNFRSDKGNVPVRHEGARLETSLRKFGAILGDRADIGCNSVLNPGSIIGKDTVVYPLSMVRGTVPANCIYKNKDEIVKKESR